MVAQELLTGRRARRSFPRNFKQLSFLSNLNCRTILSQHSYGVWGPSPLSRKGSESRFILNDLTASLPMRKYLLNMYTIYTYTHQDYSCKEAFDNGSKPKNLSTVSKVYPHRKKKKKKKQKMFMSMNHKYWCFTQENSVLLDRHLGTDINHFVRALINSPTNAHPEDGQNVEEIRVAEFREKTFKRWGRWQDLGSSNI